MLTSLTKLFLTSILIMFLIGGGRVCGCEILSWIEVQITQFASKDVHTSSCHGNHSGDEKNRENGCDHSQSDQPFQEGNCCQESLKPIIGDIPKFLVLPNLSLDEPKTHSFTSSSFLSLISEGPPVSWNTYLNSFRDHTQTRLFQQRFNI